MVASTDPAPRRASDGEALAALGAPALERQATGLRLHALAKPVRPRALALLRLVGPLHGDADRSGRGAPPPHADVFVASCGICASTLGRALRTSSARCYIRRRRGPARGPAPFRRATSEEPITPAVPPQLAHAWALIQSELRSAVPDSTYEIWLAPLTARALVENTLVIAAPDEIRSWVADRFARVLQTCAAAVLGPQTTVEVVAPDAPLHLAPAPGAGGGGAAGSQSDGERELHPKFTFDQ